MIKMPDGFKRWQLIAVTNDTIVVFREVPEKSNPNLEYADSVWQYMIAYPNWLIPGAWSVLSPTWLHSDDKFHSDLLAQAKPITCDTYAACVIQIENHLESHKDHRLHRSDKPYNQITFNS